MTETPRVLASIEPLSLACDCPPPELERDIDGSVSNDSDGSIRLMAMGGRLADLSTMRIASRDPA